MAAPTHIRNIIYRAMGIFNVPKKTKLIDLTQDIPVTLDLHFSDGLRQAYLVFTTGEKLRVDFEHNMICYLQRPLQFKDMIDNSPYSLHKPPSIYHCNDNTPEIHLPDNVAVIIIRYQKIALRLNFKTQPVEKLAVRKDTASKSAKRSASTEN